MGKINSTQLNNLLQMCTKDLHQVLQKCITFFPYVTKPRAREVQFAIPQELGCHWTLLYVDLTTNKCFYCDIAHMEPTKRCEETSLSNCGTDL